MIMLSSGLHTKNKSQDAGVSISSLCHWFVAVEKSWNHDRIFKQGRPKKG